MTRKSQNLLSIKDTKLFFYFYFLFFIEGDNMTYTTIQKVSAMLNGIEITSQTTPSTEVVQEWISEVESEIDLITNKSWGAKSFIEYLDFNGGDVLKLSKKPIITLTLSYLKGSTWTTLQEGYDKDYLLYHNDGEVLFNRGFSAGNKKFKAEYTYGYQTTPAYITRLATLMVVKRFIESTKSKLSVESGGSVRVGNIEIQDASIYYPKYLEYLNKEINDLMLLIPKNIIKESKRVF